MSLTSALSIAQSALLNTARQTSVVSRNVADASNSDYARRYAVTSVTSTGARTVEIQRATNSLLFGQNLVALSADLLEKRADAGGVSVCSAGGVRYTRDAASALAYLEATNAGTTPTPVLKALAER